MGLEMAQMLLSEAVVPTQRLAPRADLSLEVSLWQAGQRLIAGADEAGRGAWAGPLVAAAVILPADPQRLAPLLGQVDDSKRLSPLAREQLLAAICAVAVAVAVGSVSAAEIDRYGLAFANRRALAQAIGNLKPPPDYLLLDYFSLPEVGLPQQGIPHGDGRVLSIAAASIVAKVTRDRMMLELEARFPGYGFARHKGYGTQEHAAALARLGPCPLHRLSFAPVCAVARRAPSQASA